MILKNTILSKLESVDGLPSPPQVAIQVIQICQDSDANLQDLAKVLELDSALAAKILKLSNSANYSRGREITGIAQAISGLGAKTISIVALSFSLNKAIPGWKHESGLDDSQLWRHGVASGVASRALSRLARFDDPNTAFMCGLMSRIGQLLLYSLSPEDYGEVIVAADGKLPTAELEYELLGVTHHQAGRALLEKWNLPHIICEVVEYWGEAETNDHDQLLNSIVYVANVIAELIFSEDKASGLQRMHVCSTEMLQVSTGEIDRLFVSIEQELQETLDVFDDTNLPEIDCESVLQLARHQLVQVSLGLASDLTNAQDEATNLRTTNRELEKTSMTDALTDLPNRAAFDRELASLCAVRSNSDRPYTIFMVDVDHFKAFNDTHGHAVGDDVLRAVGATLAKQARATDFAARYGGEEFTVILSNAGKENAIDVAERFRRAIAAIKIEVDSETLSVTASFGIAASNDFPAGSHADVIMEAADQALYEAKRRGRNQVVSASELDESPLAEAKV